MNSDHYQQLQLTAPRQPVAFHSANPFQTLAASPSCPPRVTFLHPPPPNDIFAHYRVNLATSVQSVQVVPVQSVQVAPVQSVPAPAQPAPAPTHSSLTAIYHNCNGLKRTQAASLLRLLHHSDAHSDDPDTPLLYALVETGERKPAVPSGGSWSIIHQEGMLVNEQPSGGISIISHSSCPTTHHPGYSIISQSANRKSTDIAVATVTPHNRSAFLLVVVYAHPDLAREESGMRAVCDALSRAQDDFPLLPTLIVGDFNTRHMDWHDPGGLDNAAESMLAEHIETVGLHIHNEEGVYTRVTTGPKRTSRSIIDLVLSTPPELVTALTQQHREHIPTNDHIPFTITLALDNRLAPPPPPPSRPRAMWDTDHRPLVWQAALSTAMARHIAPLQPLLDALAQRRPPPSQTEADHDAALRQLDDVYSKLETAILTACVETVGVKVLGNNRPTQPRWWRPEVGAAERAYRDAQDRLDHTGHDSGGNTSEAYTEMREALQRYNDAVADAKQQADKQLADSASSPDATQRAAAVRKYRPTRSTPLSGIADNDGSMPASHHQSLDNLCAAFVRSSVPPPAHADYPAHIEPFSDPATHPDVWAKVDELVLGLDDVTRRHREERADAVAAAADSDTWEFTAVEVAVQVKRRTRKTSAGPDAVLPLLLPYGGGTLYKALATVYNYSWRHSVTPQAWREANVTALYKGNKSPHNDPLSYRPISVTSSIVRTFEHLIHDKLAKHIGAELADTQFGFRAHHSTSDAILQMLSSLQTLCNTARARGTNRAHLRKLRCGTLFLDIQKAFDRVDHNILLSRLHNIGVRGRAWRWIRSFLTDRRTRCVDKQNESAWHGVKHGVPQGCVLSPLLFLVFIDGLVKLIATNDGCKLISTLLYADDGALGPDLWACRAAIKAEKMTAEAFEAEYSTQLRTATTILDRWCNASRMRFGSKKTQIVVFNRGQNTDHSPYTNMRLCGYDITIANSYDYLGLTLTNDFSWTKHIKRMIQKARNAAACITTIARRADAPHPATIRELVSSYILPCFDYGIEYWGTALTEPQRRTLQAKMAQPLRSALSLPTTTHQLSVLYGNGIPDLDTHVQHKQLLHLRRVASLAESHPNHPSPALYTALTTNEDMINDHHKQLTAKAAGSAPTALYLATALLHHVLRPAPQPQPPQLEHGPALLTVMEHHPSSSKYGERAAAAHAFSATGRMGAHKAPVHYRVHLNQFFADLRAMNDPSFYKTLRQIRRDAAHSVWLESHRPATAAECAALGPTRLSHCTTAPITACLTADDNVPHTSAPPLHCMGRRHTDVTTTHQERSTLIRRARLLFGRSYTAAVRHRFPSQANIPTTDALCPFAACALQHADETIQHLLLDCPLYHDARQQLYATLTAHDLPHTLRSILNPSDNKGRSTFAAVYAATERYLDSIDAVRLDLNLPSLDHRPPAPLPSLTAQPASAPRRALQRQPHRRQRQRHQRQVAAAHRRRQQRAPGAAIAAPLIYDPG